MKKKFEIIKRKEDVIEVEAKVRYVINDWYTSTFSEYPEEVDLSISEIIAREVAKDYLRRHCREG